MIIYIGGDIWIKEEELPRINTNLLDEEGERKFSTCFLPFGYYPIVAYQVGGRVSQDPRYHRGILICKTGIGMDMLVNKFKGIRAVLGITKEVIIAARKRQDANVLCYGLYTCQIPLQEAVDLFLETESENSPNQELFQIMEERIWNQK